MTQKKSLDSLGVIVEVLSPLSAEERARLVRAAMVLLGDEAEPLAPLMQQTDGQLTYPPKAAAWMKQNGISPDQLDQAFHISGGEADFIGALPGANKKEQSLNAYIVAGIGQLLLTGDPSFEDKRARAICTQAGCYDNANHSATLKNKGNEFSGSKEKGWTLTAPGLKRGAEIVKQIQNA